MRALPTIADEITVEASFDSYSTIVILSLPVSLAAYLPQDPAIISLGPITSGNRLISLEKQQVMISPSQTSSLHPFDPEFGQDKEALSASKKHRKSKSESSQYPRLHLWEVLEYLSNADAEDVQTIGEYLANRELSLMTESQSTFSLNLQPQVVIN